MGQWIPSFYRIPLYHFSCQGSPTTSTAVVDQNETPQVEDIAIVEDVQQTHGGLSIDCLTISSTLQDSILLLSAPDTVVEEIKMGDGNMQSMGEEDDDERRDENWGRPGQVIRPNRIDMFEIWLIGLIVLMIVV